MFVSCCSCDRCAHGFWDLQETDPDGCKECTCHLHGTYNNEGCDKYSGACTCKRLVTGPNCDQCLVSVMVLATNCCAPA